MPRARIRHAIGRPGFVVADCGQPPTAPASVDHGRFADVNDPAVAILLEAGQHWATSTLDASFAACLEALRVTGLADAGDIAPHMPDLDRPAQKLVEVTDAVTVRNDGFRFEREFLGLEIIEKKGTVIAMDGDEPVTTPYDHCVLVMPSKRLQPGLTAVRLGRLVEPGEFKACG
ncbi:MAG: hypothetical protein R3C97_17645 [Geminicoccaceae bacterium]